MEDRGSGDYDYCIRPARRQKTPPKFLRTMTELEDEANSILIKECKFDACLDIFLAGLLKLGRDQSLEICGRLPDLEKLAGRGLEALKTELRGNMDRLLPGELTSDVPVLENTDLKQRLAVKWERIWRDERRYGHATSNESEKEDTPQTIPVSTFEILMEKQAKERSTRGQGSQSGSVTDRQAALTEYCRQLKDSIDSEEANGCFACGGTIPVDVNNQNTPGMKATSSPVKIFWSLGHNATARKLVLPLDGSAPESTPQLLRELVTSCDPASFGLGEKDVIDPKYRKAGKIDPEQFATSFHPADFGLLENIEQVLLPTISGEGDNILQFRKIKAELYKLNTYSGPSGLFQKHVDTPRSENQIGSLVVCLPSPFEGGSLVVQHGGQTVEFDWSQQSSSAIQWAAFYSDCEHEIKTITDGDRITLTYNLFVSEPIGGAIPSPISIVDATTFPLHSWMKELLSAPDFMEEGGVLGMFCSHAYPHTSEFAEFQFPRTLKGVDLILYSVLKSLGIELAVIPIVDKDGIYGKNPALGLRGTVGNQSGRLWYGYDESYCSMEKYLRNGTPLALDIRDRVPKDIDFADVDRRWKFLLMTRQIDGMDAIIDYAAENDLPLKPNSFYEAGFSRVGKRFKSYETTDWMIDDVDAEHEMLEHCFPYYHIPGITWITEPKHEEMAFSHVVHGNEPSIETRYSCVAILAVIPPTDKRMSIE